MNGVMDVLILDMMDAKKVEHGSTMGTCGATGTRREIGRHKVDICNYN